MPRLPAEQKPVVLDHLLQVDPVLDEQPDLDVHRVQVSLQRLVVADALGDLVNAGVTSLMRLVSDVSFQPLMIFIRQHSALVSLHQSLISITSRLPLLSNGTKVVLVLLAQQPRVRIQALPIFLYCLVPGQYRDGTYQVLVQNAVGGEDLS